MDPADFLRLIRDTARVAAPQIASIATNSVTERQEFEVAQARMDRAIENAMDSILAVRARDLCGATPTSHVRLTYCAEVAGRSVEFQELIMITKWNDCKEHAVPGLELDVPMHEIPGCTKHAVLRSVMPIPPDSLASRTLNMAIILCRPDIPVGDGPLARAIWKAAENAQLLRGVKRASLASAPAAKAVRTEPPAEKAPAPVPDASPSSSSSARGRSTPIWSSSRSHGSRGRARPVSDLSPRQADPLPDNLIPEFVLDNLDPGF